jgi:hypothetical protein
VVSREVSSEIHVEILISVVSNVNKEAQIKGDSSSKLKEIG